MWPTLMEELVTVWSETELSQSAGRVVITMRALEYMTADCFDSDFSSHLPSQRRQAIIAGMREKLPLLVTSLYQFMQLHLSSIQKLLASCGGELSTMIVHQMMMQSSLQMLGTLSMVANSAEEMCGTAHPFEFLLMECLQCHCSIYSKPTALTGLPNIIPLLTANVEAINGVFRCKLTSAALCARLFQG